MNTSYIEYFTWDWTCPVDTKCDRHTPAEVDREKGAIFTTTKHVLRYWTNTKHLDKVI